MRKSAFFGVLVLLGFASSMSFAQTNDEGLANLQFNFGNPGARSLAMGGAFVAMADDATTALANPAGLVNLIKPEVSVEFSSGSNQNTIPWTSGSQNELSAGGFEYVFKPEDFPKRTSNLSFLSFVYPLVPHKIVIAGFFDEQTKFEREFATQGFQLLKDGASTGSSFFATDNTLSMSVRNIGASIGLQPAEKLSVGVTLAYSRLDIDSLTSRISRTTNKVGNQESLVGESGKISMAVGARVSLSEMTSIGFVYKRRPKFDVTSGYFALDELGTLVEFASRPQTFKAPDSFGVGVSLRPTESISFNADINRIMYSQLMEGYYNTFWYPGISIQPPFNTPTYGKTTFEVPDGTEFRLGAEYIAMVGERPVALRGGFWREPFHSMVRKFDDSAMDESDPDVHAEPFHSRSFKEDANHVSFGGGIVLEKFAIDAAFDHSKTSDRFVVSAVVYF